jgi:diguanylate cyclase (GGDEF)-like protein
METPLGDRAPKTQEADPSAPRVSPAVDATTRQGTGAALRGWWSRLKAPRGKKAVFKGESEVVKTVLERLEASGKMPTPPGVVLRLLELTRRVDVSVREIADTVALDPGLSAKILRFVNSPMAGVGREVTSLPQAVALMGIRGVKMMALSFSVLSNAGATPCPGFDRNQFVLQSLACGVSARVLAPLVKFGSAQEAFLAGLLSQIGRSVLASAFPQEYARVLAAAFNAPRDLPDAENAEFGGTYATVGGQVLRSWGIPETLCRAIETFRGLPDEGEVPLLARLLDVSELAAVAICPAGANGASGSEAFLDSAARWFELDRGQGKTALRQIAEEVETTRTMLEIPPGRIRTPAEIEDEVRDRITELSLAMHLENQSLAKQQEDLLRRATTDPLTGVGNRAAFDARMSLELERSVRTGAPFALLMIDVDRFKAFNDTYGHQAGDRVLQTVGRLLDDNVRKVDYVARYGGEEFAVTAPATPDDGVLLLAERLRQSIEAMPVPWEGRELNITVSIGVGILHEVADAKEAAVAIIRAADEQLYAAKCAGRNCVGFKGDRQPLAAGGPRSSP